MMNNMKIGMRLTLGFGLMICFMIAIIAVSLRQMASNQQRLDYIVNTVNTRIQLANHMIDNAREVALSVRGTLLFKYSNVSGDRLRMMKNKWAGTWNTYNANIAAADKLIRADDAAGGELLGSVKTAGDTAYQLTDKAIGMALAGRTDAATAFVFERAYPSVLRWIDRNQAFIEYNQDRMAFRYAEAERAGKRLRNVLLALGILTCALAAAVAVFLTMSITTPLRTSVRTADLIAAKDLTTDPARYESRNDETGMLLRSLGTMAETLREQVREIMEGVATLSTSSNEILTATTQVASGTAENATAISETTTTVEEVRQTVLMASQKAKTVADSARQVAQVSVSGRKAVDETAAGMRVIREQMEAIARTIVRLSEMGQSIGGIIASVTDIADQSNLLAVNAAIEAARAGDHGKGFAVVAQEIRSLAEQSKQATTQVRGILNDVQKATSAAVMATEQGGKAVEAGVAQSARSGDAIRQLAEATGEAAQTATQILAASQQQQVGMDQIKAAMENINRAGTETAASMRQAETTARDLNELGERLKTMVAAFKV